MCDSPCQTDITNNTYKRRTEGWVETAWKLLEKVSVEIKLILKIENYENSFVPRGNIH